MTILASHPDFVRPNPAGSQAAEAGDGEPSWRHEMKTAIRDPRELCRRLKLPPRCEERAVRAAALFPVFAPLSFVRRMQPGDATDPLLRQVLPLDAETVPTPDFTADPVGDEAAVVVPGMLKKYRGRALLIATGSCAVHCRYCFRRHFPYGEGPRSVEQWRPVMREIAADSSIEEVLLSGGDPWTLVDSQLAMLARMLADIPHVRRLRIHTRLPIMIPSRVTDELLEWLTGTRLTPVVVIHANHAAELDDEVQQAVERLVRAGVMLLNQSVLLCGVNDDATSLIDLSRRLLDLRVAPYYLHQLDRVEGAAHFEVPQARGVELIAAMRCELPGYAVPRYVREIAGRAGKTVLA